LARNRDGTPLYQQVKDHIVQRILARHWLAGARLPSENQLTHELRVSRMTAHRALRELTAEGWLTRVQGAGTFVAEAKPQSALLEIRNIRVEIEEREHCHSCEVKTLAQNKASAEVAHALEIAPGTPIYHSVLVHKEDGEPIQVEDREVSPVFAPDYLEQDFTRTTAFEYLNGLGPMDAAEHVIEAILPTKSARRLLRVGPGDPCLLLTRRTWSDGLVVSRVRQTYPGANYRLAGRQDYPHNAGAQP
jgi:GntR family histidine utilization transcriptional repressor